MTLGPALLLLWALDEHTPTLLRPALIIGKVPLFFYLSLFLHPSAGVIVSYIRFSHIQGMFHSPDLANFPVTFPPGWGFTLPLVYLTWACIVIAIYPLSLVRRTETAQQQPMAQLPLGLL